MVMPDPAVPELLSALIQKLTYPHYSDTESD